VFCFLSLLAWHSVHRNRFTGAASSRSRQTGGGKAGVCSQSSRALRATAGLAPAADSPPNWTDHRRHLQSLSAPTQQALRRRSLASVRARAATKKRQPCSSGGATPLQAGHHKAAAGRWSARGRLHAGTVLMPRVSSSTCRGQVIAQSHRPCAATTSPDSRRTIQASLRVQPVQAKQRPGAAQAQLAGAILGYPNRQERRGQRLG